MSSIRAILLIVSSSRGHNFVFRYPANPQKRGDEKQSRIGPSDNSKTYNSNHKNASSSRPTTSTSTASSLNTSAAPSNVKRPSSSTPKLTPALGGGSGVSGKHRRQHSYNDHVTKHEDSHQDLLNSPIFGFDTHFLAALLAPRAKLCNRKFQLSVNELTFVGHPVSFDREGTERRESSDNVTVNPTNPSIPPNTTTINTTTNASQVNGATGNDPPGPPGSSSRAHSRSHSYSPSHNASPPMQSNITLFHLVFILESNDLELSREVDMVYNHFVRKITEAMRYEQQRCDYVRRQTNLILRTREEYYDLPVENLMEKILDVSALARNIAHIYSALDTNSIAHVVFNDYLDLYMQIPTIGPLNSNPYALGDNEDAMDYLYKGYEYQDYPAICPYHTLLLLEDAEEILKNLPLDASPTLAKLIQNLTPTQSLAELHTLLDCSLAQIYRLAAHLIYWRKAKLIDVINVRNVYVISPQFNLSNLPDIVREFNHQFPTLDLAHLLAQLSASPRSYMSIIPSKKLRTLYLEVLTQLLRRELVIQLHTYYLLPIPLHVKTGTAVDPGSIQDSCTTISTSGQATDSEREYIRALTAEKPVDVATLFERLVHYFDGRHHTEEILFRENISSKQLLAVTSQFREELIVLIHY
ncbi:uncharacterized protein VTP21DRAFT_9032 [Calcarisporiella thermophila]|uniref:uncharacterized protein n=1 Tax=Calcarisporiella thermophila TaxID=911321 RepID=UPI003744ADBD